MDEYKQYQQRLADITRDANYALWNALLTLNGIFISVFSAVAVFSPAAKLLSITIIGVSMLSALCLVLNFRSIRNQYRFIGQVSERGVESYTKQELAEHHTLAERLHDACNRRETASHVILGIQAVLILILVYFKS